MNRTVTAFFIIYLSASSFVFAQKEAINSVRIALKAGNSKELVKYFNDPATLEMNGERIKYSRSQAESVMKQFFQDYPPTEFSIKHQGASTKDTPYIIGQYFHDQGDYRVLIKFRDLNSMYKVDLIIFYKE